MNMLNETCPPCVNGECIPREMRCECHTGWTGENCTTGMFHITQLKIDNSLVNLFINVMFVI